MRTRLRAVVLTLVLAAALSLASAWGAKLLYLFVDVPVSHSGMIERGENLYTFYAWDYPGRTSVTLSLLPRPTGWRRSVQPAEPTTGDFEVPPFIRFPTETEVDQLATGAYGFPWRCLKSEFLVPRASAVVDAPLRDQLLLSKTFQPQGRAFSLPLRPIWPGFGANIVFWSVLLFAGRNVPRKIAAWSRKRAGLCPGCGYDLRSVWTDGCPECGWNRSAVEAERREGVGGNAS